METPSSSLPWWRTESYDLEYAMPADIRTLAGPKGPALVRAWPDGRTDPGWGLMGRDGRDGFMPRYNRGEFNDRRVLHGYGLGKWAFAFVMRSLSLVCIDIDGKNGGFDHAKRLGPVPPTMAEISKSGNGYHLFYTVDESWDDDAGFGLLSDRIGIEQGVDIRATGCVYHHPQQRWNRLAPVPLPAHLLELLQHREQKVAAASQRIDKILTNNDTMEILMMHDELITELKKPIAAGKRNQTLFAIGNQMQHARVPDWENLLMARAIEVGLPHDEANKLVDNISRYGVAPVAV